MTSTAAPTVAATGTATPHPTSRSLAAPRPGLKVLAAPRPGLKVLAAPHARLRALMGLLAAAMLVTAGCSDGRDGAGDGGPPARGGRAASLAPGTATPAAGEVAVWAMPVAATEISGDEDYTCRMFARVSASGRGVRFRVNNAIGAHALRLARATVGVREDTSGRDASGIVDARFGGRRTVTVPAGEVAWSDPVPLEVERGQSVAVSIYVADRGQPVSFHARQSVTSYCMGSGGGDRTADEDGDALGAPSLNRWVDAVSLRDTDAEGAVVWVGDSIAGGSGREPDSYERAPDVLADELDGRLAVLNSSIAGQRVLDDRLGEEKGQAVRHRFDTDVLALPGVRVVIVHAGLNDLRAGTTPDELGEAYRGLVSRAHRRGLEVVAGTATPFLGHRSKDDLGAERARQRMNAVLRHGAFGFDGVIDFDRAIRDGHEVAEQYDHDGVHPGAEGHERLAEVAMGVLADLVL